MNIYFLENVDKGDVYKNALIDAGHKVIVGNARYDDLDGCDAIFHHLAYNSRQATYRKAAKEGMKIFQYPHSTRAEVFFDGVYPLPNSYTTCYFTFGEGQKSIMRKLGVTCPIEPVGWSYTGMAPFTPTTGNKLLFMPIHVNNNKSKKGTYISRTDKNLNRQCFDILYPLRKQFDITIRVEMPEESGIPIKKGIRYSYTSPESRTNADTVRQILENDIIVSRVTAAYNAIALGVPTVMFGEDTPWHNIYDVFAKKWTDYAHLLKYPADLFNSRNPEVMLRNAQKGETQAIKKWKQLFIGEQFDAARFIDVFENYL